MHTGLIGTGHLGRALVRQFLDAKVLYPGEVMVSNRTRIKAEALAREMGTAVGGNREVAEACEVIFLCVRPIQVKEVLGELQDLLTSEKLLISTAVDFSNAQISRIVSARLARVIPSICSTTKRGITLLYFPSFGHVLLA